MSTTARELVLEKLRESAGTEVAPSLLSSKLGLSPPQLHAAVEELRSEGFQVLHRPGGYVLVDEPAGSMQEQVQALLPAGAGVGHTLLFHDTCASTNDEAKRAGEQGAAHGTVVLSRQQTGGRGRRGRTWLSLPGEHLYTSVVVRGDLPPERTSELTLVAGVALAEALEACGVAALLKWPNDLEIEDRKVAGILAELVFDPSSTSGFVVLGVGVNVHAATEDLPDEIRGRATSLDRHTDRRLSVAQVAAAFYERLDEWLVLHRSLGFDAVLDSWRARTSTLGAEVRALVDGQAIAGVAEDLDATGALLVRDAAGRQHRIVAGEVTTLRRALTP